MISRFAAYLPSGRYRNRNNRIRKAPLSQDSSFNTYAVKASDRKKDGRSDQVTPPGQEPTHSETTWRLNCYRETLLLC